LIASSDRSFRQRLSETLGSLRWQVREVEGGAQAWSEAERQAPEAVIVDAWLPDLELSEFLSDFRGRFPDVDVVTAAGSVNGESSRGPYRQELLYALRSVQENDAASWSTVAAGRAEASSPARVVTSRAQSPIKFPPVSEYDVSPRPPAIASINAPTTSQGAAPEAIPIRSQARAGGHAQCSGERLPELVGDAPCMLEISRRVRLVAPRLTPVLIEGPTGSGKELVAEAVHRLSARSQKPLIAINCAAIPEALLEAELFGHTRGAFTGAVQRRVGRIEAADGGTLFLDEIGEMPLSLQSKLLRFVECGELQRVGDNELVKVDVRIVAATHRPLAEQAHNGKFRADLYYRLAVFLIRTPSLADHAEDLPLLVEHFLEKAGRDSPVKRLDQGAMAKLRVHDWPGNVRELEHVLERGVILAGDSPALTAQEIDFGLAVN
jgi:DNA-binding NtrC family response regulator